MDSNTDENLLKSNKNVVNNPTMSKISEKASAKDAENVSWISKYGIMCGRCKKIFTLKESYLMHYNEKHPNLEIIYTCVVCLQNNKCYSKFRNHCYRHLIGGRYKCSQCSKSFSQQSQLKSHTQGFHETSFPCDMCDKKFLTRPGLKTHIKENHFDTDNEYICKECGTTLHTQNGFYKHMLMHKSQNHFLCDLCGVSFVEKSNLSIHMRNTHYTNETSYACEFCPKKFCSLSKLDEHLKMHSNMRKYRCKICNKAYKTKRYLKYHFLQHNPTVAFPCNVCSKEFFSPHKLKRHELIHEEKRYKCKYCIKDFTNFPNWLKHVRKFHKIDHKTGKPIDPENVSSGENTKLNKNVNNQNMELTSSSEKSVDDLNVIAVPLFDIYDKNDKTLSDQLCNAGAGNLDNIGDTQTYISIDNLADVTCDFSISDLQSIDINNEITILNDIDKIFTLNCSTNHNDGLCNEPQNINFTENQSITVNMSETLREQELELSDGYIREQMKGCESHIPEVPDFNVYSTPIVYDTHSPNVFDISDDSAIEQKMEIGRISTSSQSSNIHSQNSNSLTPFVLCGNYRDTDNLVTSTTENYPNISHDHTTWNKTDAPFTLDISGDTLTIDEKLSTSYSSTSFIYTNVDNVESATSDAQYNSWDIQNDTFYFADQLICAESFDNQYISAIDSTTRESVTNILANNIIDNAGNIMILMPGRN